MAVELYRRFHAMKTYGKEPESLDSIIDVFSADLADYPAEKILLAIKTHAERSQEFPTPADIIGLIRRNGRAALTEAQFVAINKKAGEDRTDADWQFLRDWEAERQSGWREIPDGRRMAADLTENTRLRSEVLKLRAEVERLTELLHAERNRKTPEPTLDKRVQKSVQWMRETNASESEIEDFIASQVHGIAA